MMHELGAPGPQFFEEIPDDGTYSYRRVGVILAGVPSDMDFYAELSTMQRSYDDVIPMQEVAKEAMHGLQARFGDRLRTTGYRDLPALDPGNFGQSHNQEYNGAGIVVGSSSTHPIPELSTVSTISGITMIADLVMFHAMKDELIRNQEATNFWFHNFQRSEYEKSVLHGALNVFVPGGPLNPIPVPDEEEEEDPEELEPEEEPEGVEEVENPVEPPAPPAPVVPPAPPASPQPLPDNKVEQAPAPPIQQQRPHSLIQEPHQPNYIHPHMSVSLREYRETTANLAYARGLGIEPWGRQTGSGSNNGSGSGGSTGSGMA
jgi:hypothetical protein